MQRSASSIPDFFTAKYKTDNETSMAKYDVSDIHIKTRQDICD
jgi:hypothetical protein